jgi:hypothetical protein
VGSLESRLRALEARSPTPRSGGLAEEVRTIDAEIRALDEELEGTEGPLDEETRAFFESLEGLSLDEKIAALEEEIARGEG